MFRESYIYGIGGEDFHNLPQIAVDLATRQETPVVIRVVYGATSQMPLRGLSYLLPPLIYMENMIQADLQPPQLQVIFANNISARLDRMDTSIATEQSRRFAYIGRSYINEFFPDMAGRIVFLEDTSLDKGSELRSRLLEVTATLKKTGSGDIVEDLARKAASNGASHTYAFYGAAHVLIHDMDIPGALMSVLPDQPDTVANPDFIISIGGKQEEIFYKIRQAVKPHLGPEYRRIRTLQYFTRHHVPPYYMARGGDIALDDVISDASGISLNGIAAAARHDLEYLHNFSFFRGDLSEFLRNLGGKQ